MKNVIKCLLLLWLTSPVFAQHNQDNLKKEQRKLEKKITQTKSLLKKVQLNSKASLQEVKLLDNQIKSREALVSVFDSQIRIAEMKMTEKKNDISRLQKRLLRLKNQYRKMLYYAYKRRNNNGKLMFLLSAKSYNEANKRNSYLKKVARLQKRQFELIKQHKNLIHKEIGEISNQKSQKELALNEKKEEKSKIEFDKFKKEKSYSKLKQEEEKLLSQLKEDESKRRKIETQIQSAIIAEAKKEEERRRKKENDATATGKTTKPKDSKPDKSPESNPKYKPETLSSEGAVAGKNFEANKGVLPSPVTNGSITSKYGRNAHPNFKEVYENNNGIDITCSAGSNIRSVFEGEVSSVFSIAGAGKVVILKHGNYRSVYSNLASVSVHVGDKINTKQTLGSLLSDDGVSVLHFEIHSVNGINTTPLNPSLWLSR